MIIDEANKSAFYKVKCTINSSSLARGSKPHYYNSKELFKVTIAGS